MMVSTTTTDKLIQDEEDRLCLAYEQQLMCTSRQSKRKQTNSPISINGSQSKKPRTQQYDVVPNGVLKHAIDVAIAKVYAIIGKRHHNGSVSPSIKSSSHSNPSTPRRDPKGTLFSPQHDGGSRLQIRATRANVIEKMIVATAGSRLWRKSDILAEYDKDKPEFERLSDAQLLNSLKTLCTSVPPRLLMLGDSRSPYRTWIAPDCESHGLAMLAVDDAQRASKQKHQRQQREASRNNSSRLGGSDGKSKQTHEIRRDSIVAIIASQMDKLWKKSDLLDEFNRYHADDMDSMSDSQLLGDLKSLCESFPNRLVMIGESRSPYRGWVLPESMALGSKIYTEEEEAREVYKRQNRSRTGRESSAKTPHTHEIRRSAIIDIILSSGPMKLWKKPDIAVQYTASKPNDATTDSQLLGDLKAIVDGTEHPKVAMVGEHRSPYRGWIAVEYRAEGQRLYDAEEAARDLARRQRWSRRDPDNPRQPLIHETRRNLIYSIVSETGPTKMWLKPDIAKQYNRRKDPSVNDITDNQLLGDLKFLANAESPTGLGFPKLAMIGEHRSPYRGWIAAEFGEEGKLLGVAEDAARKSITAERRKGQRGMRASSQQSQRSTLSINGSTSAGRASTGGGAGGNSSNVDDNDDDDEEEEQDTDDIGDGDDDSRDDPNDDHSMGDDEEDDNATDDEGGVKFYDGDSKNTDTSLDESDDMDDDSDDDDHGHSPNNEYNHDDVEVDDGDDANDNVDAPRPHSHVRATLLSGGVARLHHPDASDDDDNDDEDVDDDDDDDDDDYDLGIVTQVDKSRRLAIAKIVHKTNGTKLWSLAEIVAMYKAHRRNDDDDDDDSMDDDDNNDDGVVVDPKQIAHDLKALCDPTVDSPLLAFVGDPSSPLCGWISIQHAPRGHKIYADGQRERSRAVQQQQQQHPHHHQQQQPSTTATTTTPTATPSMSTSTSTSTSSSTSTSTLTTKKQRNRLLETILGSKGDRLWTQRALVKTCNTTTKKAKHKFLPAQMQQLLTQLCNQHPHAPIVEVGANAYIGTPYREQGEQLLLHNIDDMDDVDDDDADSDHDDSHSTDSDNDNEHRNSNSNDNNDDRDLTHHRTSHSTQQHQHHGATSRSPSPSVPATDKQRHARICTLISSGGTKVWQFSPVRDGLLEEYGVKVETQVLHADLNQLCCSSKLLRIENGTDVGWAVPAGDITETSPYDEHDYDYHHHHHRHDHGTNSSSPPPVHNENPFVRSSQPSPAVVERGRGSKQKQSSQLPPKVRREQIYNAILNAQCVLLKKHDIIHLYADPISDGQLLKDLKSLCESDPPKLVVIGEHRSPYRGWAIATRRAEGERFYIAEEEARHKSSTHRRSKSSSSSVVAPHDMRRQTVADLIKHTGATKLWKKNEIIDEYNTVVKLPDATPISDSQVLNDLRWLCDPAHGAQLAMVGIAGSPYRGWMGKHYQAEGEELFHTESMLRSRQSPLNRNRLGNTTTTAAKSILPHELRRLLLVDIVRETGDTKLWRKRHLIAEFNLRKPPTIENISDTQLLGDLKHLCDVTAATPTTPPQPPPLAMCGDGRSPSRGWVGLEHAAVGDVLYRAEVARREETNRTKRQLRDQERSRLVKTNRDEAATAATTTTTTTTSSSSSTATPTAVISQSPSSASSPGGMTVAIA